MKRILAGLFSLLCTAQSEAQNKVIDSLNRLIAGAKTDTARINHAVAKVNKLTEINLDESIRFGKGVIQEARQAGYEKGQAEARIQVASGYMRKGIYDSAVYHLNTAQQAAAALNDSVLLAKVFGSYGMLYGMQSKYDTSIQYIERAIGIELRHGATAKLASRYGNLAIGYQMLSNFTQALYYQQQALRLSEAANDISQQAYTLMNMGITYLSMGDTLRSEQMILKAVQLAKKQGINNVELYGYSNLASLYDGRPQLGEKSYAYAIKAAELAKQLGDDGIEAASLSKAALALARTGRFARAETLSRQAITIADSSAHPYNIFQAYTSMGRVYQLQQRCSDAIPYFTKGLAVLDKADLYEKSIQGIYADLAKCYEQVGDPAKALAALKMSAQIKDSITGRENIRKATELSMNYEFEKKQSLAAALQGRKDAETRSKQTLLLAGLIVVLALAIGAWVAFKNKQKTAAQLQQQKGELQQALNKLKETQAQLIQSEKMASLGELTAGVAHEIQNPLNFVNNFSEVSNELADEMQAALANGDIVEAKAIAADITANLQKIAHHGKRADGIVKGMLQHSRAATGQKEPTNINALCDEYLRLSYHGLRAKDKSFNATLKTDFDAALGKVAVVPQDMGRVILNLVNNAFYAVMQQAAKAKAEGDTTYEPTVELATKRRQQHVEIRVKDNGGGIPESVVNKIFQPFFTTKPTGQGTGLGLSLSYDIIKAHGGEIKVESEDGEGSTFVIELPSTQN